MSGSDVQVWWYSFWIKFEIYFTNIILIARTNCFPGLSVISSLRFRLRCIATPTSNMRAESFLIRQQPTPHYVHLVGRPMEAIKMLAAHYIFPSCVCLQIFTLLVAKFTYQDEATPPTWPSSQHSVARGMNDRCCSKPRNLFSQYNRRTPVSETSLYCVNWRLSACWLCPANCRTVGVLLQSRLGGRGGGEFFNKPQQSYNFKPGAQTELGILLQLLGVLYKSKNRKALCGVPICLSFCRTVSTSKGIGRFSWNSIEEFYVKSRLATEIFMKIICVTAALNLCFTLNFSEPI